ncbi:PKD domain-containing protein [Chitinophaga sp.]|uniref:PKD domain-containing protein n=1 Tax=Chitinophaga sp. TaxID=1869181 RepID=UPI0031CEA9A1
MVLNQGLPKQIAKGAKMNFTVGGKVYKFIVVSPQFSGGWASADMTQSIIEDMKARYRVDASRIYLTGLSAGGQGVWTYVSTSKQYADNIAAVVPVSPAGMGAQLVSNICNTVVAANVPVWQFAGSSDLSGGINFLSNLQTFETKYNSCNPAVKAKSTVVQGGGHNAVTWDAAYDPTHNTNNPNIYEWMLQYTQEGTVTPPPPVQQPPVANAGPQVSLTLPANTAQLDGSASKPATAAISTYEWKKVAGPAQFSITGDKAAKASLTNLVAGTYTFELKVTDQNGLSSTAQTQVAVAPAAAPSCANCKFTITPQSGTQIYGNTLGVQPGDTVCVMAGNYVSLMFNNFTGTPDKPIVFINCGGQVKFGNNGNYGLGFVNSKYFRITGTGSSDKYGFVVDGSAKPLQTGMAVGKECTDYEVDHIEIGHVGVGMFAKINPDCEAINQHPNFVIRNVKLHDLYVHDTEVEGLYVGNTSPNGTEIVCNGQTVTVYPPRIENVKIYNVITKNTGWDGIQVSTAPVGVEIYDNDVSNYGIAKAYGQNAGILLGGSASGVVRNNKVSNGAGPNLMVFGIGQIKIYNNLLTGAGTNPIEPMMDDGIFIDDRKNMYPDKPLQVQVFNNTIINPSRNGIRLLNTYGTVASGNLFYNNIVVNPGQYEVHQEKAYLATQGTVNFEASNNLFVRTLPEAGFVNAAGLDFSLAAGSAAIDAGRDVSSFGVKYDINYKTRPGGAAFDIGAYELAGGGGTGSNKPPVANAGADQTITLPASSVRLNGSASSDPDGTIASYNWAKVSGPEATIAQSTAAATDVTGLTAGTYVFELTVKDDKGATATARVTVTVNTATNKPPAANAGPNVTITLPVNSVRLDGSASSDPDGTIASYNWVKIGGPAATIAQPTAAATDITGLVAGTYVFELTVKDDKGAVATSNVTVTVNSATNQPPVADAGDNITITLPVSSVRLDGSGSADPDGSIASYSWVKLGGPAATIAQSSSAATDVTGLTAGTYVFQLTVKDDKGAVATSNVTITVKTATNQPPVAHAGYNNTVTLPLNSIRLDGSASSDPDGTIASYNWVKIGGPAATIAQPTSAATDVTGLVAGTYVFELTVKDDKGAIATSNVTVTVNSATNLPPVANAGYNTTITLPVSSVRLDGSGSADPDGTIASYNWVKLGGPAAATIAQSASAVTDVTGLTAGTYVFQLTVKDDKGAVATSNVTITVKTATNQPPVAHAGYNNTVTLPLNSIRLDGSLSSDPDGSIASYTWTELGGPVATIAQPGSAVTEVTGITKAGTYVFMLTVKDNSGATASSNVTVTVIAATNTPPLANAGADVNITLPASSAQLDGSASSDADGNIVSYAWAKISGPAATIGQPAAAGTSVTGLTEGVYVFELTVKDNQGATGTDRVTVTVHKADVPNKPPVANAGADITISQPANATQLNGGGSSDADGSIASYAWTKISGPAATISQPGSAVTTITGLTEGTYIFELVVTDNQGATAADRVTVTVLKEVQQGNQPPVANAGPDQTINVNEEELLLIGSGSHDPDGSIVSYSWRQLSGPATVSILSPGSIQTGIAGVIAGEYRFQLTVTDNKGATATATVKVVVIKDAGVDSVAVALFPNPVSTKMQVRINLQGKEEVKALSLLVLNMAGQVQKHIRLGDNPVIQTEVDMSDLGNGIYIVRISDGQGFNYVYKIVKAGY